ncbi:60S acidic ribosomal protein P2 [Podila epigama]|nr:60S acidic ribosomal protein P2 [Podila epigama]
MGLPQDTTLWTSQQAALHHHHQHLAPVPEDCLVIIIELLGQDRATLYALLRVSRQFFRLTVPALYRSPFRMLEREPITWPERTQRQVLLLQLFLKTLQLKQLESSRARSLSLSSSSSSSSTFETKQEQEVEKSRRHRQQQQQPQQQQQQLQAQHQRQPRLHQRTGQWIWQQQHKRQQQQQDGSQISPSPSSALTKLSIFVSASRLTWGGGSSKRTLQLVIPLSKTLSYKRRIRIGSRRRLLLRLPLSKKESNVKSLSSSSSSSSLPASQDVLGVPHDNHRSSLDSSFSSSSSCATHQNAWMSTALVTTAATTNALVPPSHAQHQLRCGHLSAVETAEEEEEEEEAQLEQEERDHRSQCSSYSASIESTSSSTMALRRQSRAAKAVKSLFSMPGMYAGWWVSSMSPFSLSSKPTEQQQHQQQQQEHNQKKQQCDNNTHGPLSCPLYNGSLSKQQRKQKLQKRRQRKQQQQQQQRNHLNNMDELRQQQKHISLDLANGPFALHRDRWVSDSSDSEGLGANVDIDMDFDKKESNLDKVFQDTSSNCSSNSNCNGHSRTRRRFSRSRSSSYDDGSGKFAQANSWWKRNKKPSSSSYITKTPWPWAEPDLGPFNTPATTRPSPGRSTWPILFPRRSLSGTQTSEVAEAARAKGQGDMTEQLMADYLYHYIEHDHLRLVRQLSFIFPTIPRDVFENLSPSTFSTGWNNSALSSAGHGTQPLASSPTNHPVLNLLQSFQQPQKNNRTIEMAQATRIKIERDLLHYAPHRIRTLCISAPRFHTILGALQEDNDDELLPPLQNSANSNHSSWREDPGIAGASITTSSSSSSQQSSQGSSFSSLFSFLSSSPFRSLPSSISSSVSTWPLSSSSSSSSSSSFSTSSSVSSSSSSTLSLPSSASSTSLPCRQARNSGMMSTRLSHLCRLELLDIHYKFDVEAIVDFLCTHERVYGTLREIKIGGPDDMGRSSLPGLIRILQSVQAIRVLDMTHWREAIKYLDMIPTRSLETLLLGNVRMTTLNSSTSSNGDGSGNDHGVLLEQPQPQSNIQHQSQVQEQDQEQQEQQQQEDPQIQTLKKCRRLKELRMPVLVDGLFEWAVEERNQRRRGQRYWGEFPEPMELESVHLSGSNTGPLVPTLVHVVDAFRDTLQTLQSMSWSDMAETLPNDQSLSWHWRLPRLQVLDLQGEIAFRFKTQALEHCPELRVLRLSLPHSVFATTSTPALIPSASSSPTTPVSASASASVATLSSPLTATSPQEPVGHREEDAVEVTSFTCLADLFSPRGVKKRRSILPVLQELSLAGDWGLNDASLLGMAEVLPTLTRLSLLRCGSSSNSSSSGSMGSSTDGGGQGMSVNGLLRALPKFRMMYWLEVDKGWQSDLVDGLHGRSLRVVGVSKGRRGNIGTKGARKSRQDGGISHQTSDFKLQESGEMRIAKTENSVSLDTDVTMKYLAAYLLLSIGGNAAPSAKDITALLATVGIEAESERIETLISQLAGKDINETKAEEKKEEAKEESDDDMGFGLFD